MRHRVPLLLVVAVASACGTSSPSSQGESPVPPVPGQPIIRTQTTQVTEVVPTTTGIATTTGSTSGPPNTDWMATVAPGSPEATAPSVPPLDLTGVIPESVPMVIGEQLGLIQLAVRNTVSDDVFTGTWGEFGDSADVQMTIYGTDVAAIEAVLDQIGGDVRDRISVVEAPYAQNELEQFANDATNRLRDASIDASVLITFPYDRVEVDLHTPDGQPDRDLEATARSLLGDIPVEIRFQGPVILL